MQVGLVLKPGPQEPWTPYRMAEAFFAAGIPREAISIYPGARDVGAAVLDRCDRSLMFGGQAAVDRYRGDPRGPGARPRLLEDPIGDDVVDTGSSTSTCWSRASSRTAAAAASTARGSGPAATRARSRTRSASASRQSVPLKPDHPEASLAAFTVPGVADGDLRRHRRRPAGARRDRRHRRSTATRIAGREGTGSPTICCRRSSTARRTTRRSPSRE